VSNQEDIAWCRAQMAATYGPNIPGDVDIDALTDEEIRAHWNMMDATPGFGADMSCYYALGRNARRRAGNHSDDEFSRFCDDAARIVCAAIAKRKDGGS
jgi:hypothetical protein